MKNNRSYELGQKKITCGEYRGRAFNEVRLVDLACYCEWLLNWGGGDTQELARLAIMIDEYLKCPDVLRQLHDDLEVQGWPGLIWKNCYKKGRE